MSFDHKAFEFEWESFSIELAPLLAASLSNNDTSKLHAFINSNVACCASPYDGEPLSQEWESLLEVGGVQEMADFALTKYYSPLNNFGLSENWVNLEALLNPEQKPALLGEPFGNAGSLFDPGCQGSYFQTPVIVANSVNVLANSTSLEICKYSRVLGSVAAKKKGLYVTF
jgi:hypothetical protein